MSDRILVLHEGRITAEIPRARATEERVMFAATGNVEPLPVGETAGGSVDG
jgi:rhamnose transport system ATP-binding protein